MIHMFIGHRHPTAAFFHIIFKLASIVLYLFGGLFGQGLCSPSCSVLLIVLTLRLLVDIRFTYSPHIIRLLDCEERDGKTVGRSSLVELHWRWGSESLDVWEQKQERDRKRGCLQPQRQIVRQYGRFDHFLGRTDRCAPSLVDSPIGHYLSPQHSVVCEYYTNWLRPQITNWPIDQMVVSLALVLSGSNLYGYIRCKFGGNFKSVVGQYVGKQIFYNVSKTLFGFVLNSILCAFSSCRHLIRRPRRIWADIRALKIIPNIFSKCLNWKPFVNFDN